RRYGFEGIRMTLATTAGPELAPNQSGEEELMPFEVLDACLYLYGAEKLAADEVSRALPSLFLQVDPARLAAWSQKFAKLFTRSIFKWVQSPLALHVGSLDLDRERALQLPVVQRTEWSGEEARDPSTPLPPPAPCSLPLRTRPPRAGRSAPSGRSRRGWRARLRGVGASPPP